MITIDDDGVVFKNGLSIVAPRDSNYSPFALMGGFDPSENYAFAQFTSSGKLRVDATVNPTGDVIMKAYDDTATLQDLQVVLDPGTLRWALMTEDPRFQFSGGALNVNLVAVAEAGGENKFGTTPTLDGLWATVVTHTVLAGETYDVCGFSVWGDADAEWALLVGATQKGGARTSPSKLMESVDYSQNIVVTGPATVTIKAKHWYAGKTINFYANLLGRTC